MLDVVDVDGLISGGWIRRKVCIVAMIEFSVRLASARLVNADGRVGIVTIRVL